MNKADLAASYKRSMNCCQAVLCAYADELGADRETLCRLGAGFGSGMGTMGATCGALCGAQMVLGMSGKAPAMPQAKQLYRQFEARCGSTVCRELKGVGTGRVLCSCEDCVRNAAALVEEAFAPDAV